MTKSIRQEYNGSGLYSGRLQCGQGMDEKMRGKDSTSHPVRVFVESHVRSWMNK